MDIPGSYNTNNIGLIKAVKEHNAKLWVGKTTLFNLYNFPLMDYGDISNVITDVYKEFKLKNTDTVVQFNKKLETPVCEKLVNIWTLQQNLQQKNNIEDYLILHYTIKNGQPFCDIHPGRTRIFFKYTYKNPINVLVIDYANMENLEGFIEFTEDVSKNFKDQEYRLKHNWGMPFDNDLKHLLVQPNNNEQWHWPYLQQPITFKMYYDGRIITKITANNKPFIEFFGTGWKIVI